MVVATLAIVEDPSPPAYLPVDDSDDQYDSVKKSGVSVEEDALPATSKPITSELRSTISHIRARAGRGSRFRGFGMFMLWSILSRLVSGVLSFGQGHQFIFINAAAQVVSEILLANLMVAWVHIVITEPSARSMWRRIPSLRNWTKYVPAVALHGVAAQVCMMLPVYLAMCLGAFRMDDENMSELPEDARPSAGKVGAGLGVTALSLALTILIEVPATVTLVRVAASMLPDDENTIVPFDRTFGGKVVPTLAGGTGRIGLLDAWTTFNWPARIRLLKVLVKTFGMMVAVSLVFAAVLAAEVAIIAGGDFKSLLGKV